MLMSFLIKFTAIVSEIPLIITFSYDENVAPAMRKDCRKYTRDRGKIELKII